MERKRNQFLPTAEGKRRLFSHFGSAIINFIVKTFFSIFIIMHRSCWMRAKIFFTTIATILLQYDTFKGNISIQWSTVWMCGRWTIALIYINTHSKTETYCGGYETSLNGLRNFCFVFNGYKKNSKFRFAFELKCLGIYIESPNLGKGWTKSQSIY